MKNKYRYCITGASGFVGSNFVEFLVNNVEYKEILCLVREKSDVSFLKKLPVKIKVVEFNNPKTYEKHINNCDYLFQFIGLTYAKKLSFLKYVNKKIANNFLNLYLKYKTKLKGYFFMSSLAVVGEKKQKEEKATRKNNLNPVSKYGKTKLMGEKLHWNHLNEDNNINILRAPAIYGKRDREMRQFFDTVKKGIVPIIGFGKNKLTLINISDLVKFVFEITVKSNHNGIFYIYDNNIYTQKKLGKITKEILNPKSIQIYIPPFLAYIAAYLNELFSDNYIYNREKYKEMRIKNWAYRKNDFTLINKTPKYDLYKGLKKLYK